MVPLAIGAQAASKVARIGYLSADTLTTASTFEDAFRQGLRELGYVEDRNIAIGKQLELLKETVARVSQNPDATSHQFMLREAAGAARALGVQLRVLGARSPAPSRSGIAKLRGDCDRL